jgi:deazaflavin-dependent oxidoreductase (nitroreductase family)
MSDDADEAAANRTIIQEFRANGGQLGNWYRGGPLILLHTRGAKSGAPRVNPLLYRDLGGSYAVFASYRGSPRRPAWYHNLLAQPQVEIEFGSRRVRARATVVHGAGREKVWTAHTHDYPNFIEYPAKAGREIPVVVLQPE